MKLILVLFLKFLLSFQRVKPNKYLTKAHNFLINGLFFAEFYQLGLEGFIEFLIVIFL